MKYLYDAFFFNLPRSSGSVFLITIIIHKHIALFIQISKHSAKVSLFCRWENIRERWGACLEHHSMSEVLHSAHSLVPPKIRATFGACCVLRCVTQVWRMPLHSEVTWILLVVSKTMSLVEKWFESLSKQKVTELKQDRRNTSTFNTIVSV